MTFDSPGPRLAASPSSATPGPAEPAADRTAPFGLAELIATSASASAPIRQAGAPAPGGGAIALVGVCVDDRHPTLAGRVQVRYADEAGERALWLATLAHLPVRCEDRVLLLQPGNWPEPIVVGVIDGLRAREGVAHAEATLTLRADETLEIRGADGAPLLAIRPDAGRPGAAAGACRSTARD